MEMYGDSGKCYILGTSGCAIDSKKNVSVTTFTQSNLDLVLSDLYCRILTMRSYLGMKKTSRPYEMDFGIGEIRFRDHSEASRGRRKECQCSVPRCTSQEKLYILPGLPFQQRHAQPIDRAEETQRL